eukprot:Gregarina_sp_Poly_1__688@NODE_1163_length_4887_cov_131_620332_g798_i0_p5_GENE_NODE_1163_length_4887_cov_131_620332_g798_i0NODE_1163_length_4887_cov_131_620332_g798_i0_p5_ORF_typecomplete_len115_score8_94_NODE_1163_length_4887_cov_131_620332_g798_i015701914
MERHQFAQCSLTIFASLASLLVCSELIFRAFSSAVLPTPHLPITNQTNFLKELMLTPTKQLSNKRQVIICPGNNDADYDYAAEKNSEWNSIVYRTWARLGGIPKDQQEVRYFPS